MREILFRGKRVKKYCKEQDWTEGVPYIDHEGDCIMATHCSKYVVDPETVGQYTGLTDKNGKMIFEGDILKRYGFCYVVSFESGAFLAYETPYNESAILPKRDWENAVIIGNIHDNPELRSEDGWEGVSLCRVNVDLH